jgi:hypothetical protein
MFGGVEVGRVMAGRVMIGRVTVGRLTVGKSKVRRSTAGIIPGRRSILGRISTVGILSMQHAGVESPHSSRKASEPIVVPAGDYALAVPLMATSVVA